MSMTQLLYFIAIFVVWVIAAFYFLGALYHFIKMLTQYKSKGHYFVGNLVPGLSIFCSSFYNKEGQRHLELFQSNFLKSMLLGVLFAIGVLILRHNG